MTRQDERFVTACLLAIPAVHVAVFGAMVLAAAVKGGALG